MKIRKRIYDFGLGILTGMLLTLPIVYLLKIDIWMFVGLLGPFFWVGFFIILFLILLGMK